MVGVLTGFERELPAVWEKTVHRSSVHGTAWRGSGPKVTEDGSLATVVLSNVSPLAPVEQGICGVKDERLYVVDFSGRTMREDPAEGVLPCATCRPTTWPNPPVQPLTAGAELMEPAQRDRFLTVRWNNWLSIGLGLPALIFVGVALSTDLLSDRAEFVWLVLIGVVY